MDERRQVEPEQRLRPQPGQTEQAIGEDARAQNTGVGEARQQERVGPHQDAGAHAGDGAARGAAPPDQPAEKRRRELGDGGEGQKPDRGELRRAGRAVIDVGETQDGEDGDAADHEELRAGVARSGAGGAAL